MSYKRIVLSGWAFANSFNDSWVNTPALFLMPTTSDSFSAYWSSNVVLSKLYGNLINLPEFHFPMFVVTLLDSYRLLPIKVRHRSKESSSPFSLLYPDCKISPVVTILKLSCLANSSNSRYCSRDT